MAAAAIQAALTLFAGAGIALMFERLFWPVTRSDPKEDLQFRAQAAIWL